jgi:microcystin degradation protein MlrC
VQAAIDKLETMVIERETEFAEPLLTPDEAVIEAMGIAKKANRPVIIADTQDNPGCGGTGDTTGLLDALVRHDAIDAVLCVFTDTDAALAAHQAGIGARLTIAIGGKHNVPGVEAFKGKFEVTHLSAGTFVTTGRSIPGRQINLGPCAVLRIGGVSVFVSSKRMQAYDQDILRHIGIDPVKQKILALKSTCHFRADFDYIAERTLIAIAPGAHIVDPRAYPYRHLRSDVKLLPSSGQGV